MEADIRNLSRNANVIDQLVLTCVYAVSVKFAQLTLHVLFLVSFSLCFTCGFLPADMIQTTIVQITKNGSGILADNNNYKSIAIATIISKCFETINIYQCEFFCCFFVHYYVRISLHLNLSTVLYYVFFYTKRVY